MRTVLGANGPIGEELVRELHRSFTQDIRVVSRKPERINDTDELVAADLTDPEATDRAVAGSEVAYLTVGLPMDSELWERQFPVMMRNVIDACEKHGTKLVFFDNTYTYAGTPTPQTESAPFAPNGRKGRVRAELATMVLDAMATGRIEALICRAPEFYGPGRTKSLTNTLVFDRIKAGKRPFVPISAKTRRSLIWTPDASRTGSATSTSSSLRKRSPVARSVGRCCPSGRSPSGVVSTTSSARPSSSSPATAATTSSTARSSRPASPTSS